MLTKNVVVVTVKNVSLVLLGMLMTILLIATFNEQQLFLHLETYSVANAAASKAERMNQQVDETNLEMGVSEVSCRPVEVKVARKGFYVKCAEAVGGIKFFALALSDVTHANRILSILSTAYVSGKTLVIEYDPGDTSGEKTIGCLANDCRLILAAGMW